MYFLTYVHYLCPLSRPGALWWQGLYFLYFRFPQHTRRCLEDSRCSVSVVKGFTGSFCPQAVLASCPFLAWTSCSTEYGSRVWNMLCSTCPLPQWNSASKCKPTTTWAAQHKTRWSFTVLEIKPKATRLAARNTLRGCTVVYFKSHPSDFLRKMFKNNVFFFF